MPGAPEGVRGHQLGQKGPGGSRQDFLATSEPAHPHSSECHRSLSEPGQGDPVCHSHGQQSPPAGEATPQDPFQPDLEHSALSCPGQVFQVQPEPGMLSVLPGFRGDSPSL